jgi:hypothetical protein
MGLSAGTRYRKGKINALDRAQNKVAKFANDTKYLGWETLAKRKKVASICALFKAYTGERARKSIGNRLKGPCYLSRDDHDRKIRDTRQGTDIGKYSCVYSTIKMWNKLPAKALETFYCHSRIFRKRVRNIILSVEK